MTEPGTQTSVPSQNGSGTAPLLSLHGIYKAYGSVRALQDVSVEIGPGEIHAVVGDNGAGKSTLVKIISGAHRPDAGTIMFQGAQTQIGTPDGALALGIATVYQDLAVIRCRTVMQNIFLGREPRRRLFVDRKRMARESRTAIDDLGVANLPSVHTEVGSLSGGQRQAVAIARAVAEGPRVMILDEPTAALGVRESRNVLNLVARLRSQGIAVVLVSHNLAHVFELSDTITVLRAGRLVGTTATTATTPDAVVSMITGAHASLIGPPPPQTAVGP